MGFTCDACGSQELWQMATYVQKDGEQTIHPDPHDEVVRLVCRDCAKVCPCGTKNKFCVRCTGNAVDDAPKVGPDSP